MIIHTMRACFGRLQQEELVLQAGLNVIEAPNEGGKSTWSAFLRAMLYGINTKQRDKQGYIAEKNRYQPWSGAPMEGTMELTWQGRDITLRRSSRAGAPRRPGGSWNGWRRRSPGWIGNWPSTGAGSRPNAASGTRRPAPPAPKRRLWWTIWRPSAAVMARPRTWKRCARHRRI